MMIDDFNIQLVKDELLQSIAYFVQRQALVAQALQDFGLDLNAIAVLGAGGWTIGSEGAKQLYQTLPQNFETNFRNALQRMIENQTPSVNQTGNWEDKTGETWSYFMHGGGCQLINKITGEVIDWDCPDTTRFDRFKFAFHLEWQIQNFPDNYPHLTKYLSNNDLHTIGHNLIPDLVNEGRLKKDLTNHYRIS